MRDCTQIPDYSGERLSCEVQNEAIKMEKDQSFAMGALCGIAIVVGFILFWKFITWLEKKEEREYTRHPY